MVRANRGNRSERRGRGFKRHTLATLLPAERAAIKGLAETYGYNELTFLLAIISGEVATVMLGQEPDERPHAIQALEASGDPVLLDIAAQLRRAAERGRAGEDIEEAIEERRS